ALAGQVYEIHIDTSSPHDGIADLTFRITFSVPDAQGHQSVTLTSLPANALPFDGIIAQGLTGVKIPIATGGMFRASIQDEPVFFDQGAFDTLHNTGAVFPRPVGQAHNFFGPNGNTFSAVLETPSVQIPLPAANTDKVLGVWATISKN